MIEPAHLPVAPLPVFSAAGIGGSIPPAQPVQPRAAYAQRLLYTRQEAAYMLSLSIRSLDYYISRKKLNTRRMGRKILIPHGELVRFSRADHTEDIRSSSGLAVQ